MAERHAPEDAEDVAGHVVDAVGREAAVDDLAEVAEAVRLQGREIGALALLSDVTAVIRGVVHVAKLAFELEADEELRLSIEDHDVLPGGRTGLHYTRRGYAASHARTQASARSGTPSRLARVISHSSAPGRRFTSAGKPPARSATVATTSRRAP